MRVAVLGLGLIGSIWARHYAAAGVLAATWNRSPRPDAPSPTPTPADAAHAADIIHIVVADPPAVRSLLASIQTHLRPGRLVVQSSTIDPESSLEFANLVQATGALYLEAPFTGSRPAAEERRTVFYISGTADAKAAAEPALTLLSASRVDCGDGPQAAWLKLAFNLQLAVQMEGLAESLAFARRAGLADDLYFGALRSNAAWSGLTTLKEPKLRSGDFSPQFSVKHMLKDVRLALAAAGDLGLDLDATAAAARRLADLAAKGGADLDYAALAGPPARP